MMSECLTICNKVFDWMEHDCLIVWCLIGCYKSFGWMKQEVIGVKRSDVWFDLILYIPVNNISDISGLVFLG